MTIELLTFAFAPTLTWRPAGDGRWEPDGWDVDHEEALAVLSGHFGFAHALRFAAVALATVDEHNLTIDQISRWTETLAPGKPDVLQETLNWFLTDHLTQIVARTETWAAWMLEHPTRIAGLYPVILDLYPTLAERVHLLGDYPHQIVDRLIDILEINDRHQQIRIELRARNVPIEVLETLILDPDTHPEIRERAFLHDNFTFDDLDRLTDRHGTQLLDLVDQIRNEYRNRQITSTPVDDIKDQIIERLAHHQTTGTDVTNRTRSARP